MGGQESRCVILADRNAAMSEGIRGLLEAEFDSVYVVADVRSLTEGAARLAPCLLVIDLSIGLEGMPDLLLAVRGGSPESKVVILAIHEDPTVVEAMLSAGADAVVLKRCAGRDLFEAIMAIEHGGIYVSPGFGFGSARSRGTGHRAQTS